MEQLRANLSAGLVFLTLLQLVAALTFSAWGPSAVVQSVKVQLQALQVLLSRHEKRLCMLCSLP